MWRPSSGFQGLRREQGSRSGTSARAPAAESHSRACCQDPVQSSRGEEHESGLREFLQKSFLFFSPMSTMREPLMGAPRSGPDLARFGDRFFGAAFPAETPANASSSAR